MLAIFQGRVAREGRGGGEMFLCLSCVGWEGESKRAHPFPLLHLYDLGKGSVHMALSLTLDEVEYILGRGHFIDR